MRFEKWGAGGKFISYKREGERRPERERRRGREREREIEEWREREKGYNYGMTWHGMD